MKGVTLNKQVPHIVQSSSWHRIGNHAIHCLGNQWVYWLLFGMKTMVLFDHQISSPYRLVDRSIWSSPPIDLYDEVFYYYYDHNGMYKVGHAKGRWKESQLVIDGKYLICQVFGNFGSKGSRSCRFVVNLDKFTVNSFIHEPNFGQVCIFTYQWGILTIIAF